MKKSFELGLNKIAKAFEKGLNYINNVSYYSLISSFYFTLKSLASYIKIRTGDPNESDITYWMLHDFKSNKDWVRKKNLLAKKEQEIS